VNDKFITGAGQPYAVAVNADHIYWANQAANSIGRANIDGGAVDPNFITGGLQLVSGVAVSSKYVFWATAQTGDQWIGRANLDGTSPLPHLVGTLLPCGVAVDSGHVYWVSDGSPSSTIGRASFSGSPVNDPFVTIPGTSFPCGLAVNAANVFWTDTGFFGGGFNIGRANVVTGLGADASIIGDASTPSSIAVDGSHLYWANAGTNTIGRSNLDATGVNESFFATGAAQTTGVAIDSLAPPPPPPPPSNALTLGRPKLHPRQGTATLAVTIASAGTLRLTGKGVVGLSVSHAAGTVRLPIRAKSAARTKLDVTGAARVKAIVIFTPTGGTANSANRSIKLVKTG
jgi:hypothetical protein